MQGEGGEEGSEVRGAMRIPLFSLLLGAFSWEEVEGVNAAGEAEFCCTQEVFAAPAI